VVPLGRLLAASIPTAPRPEACLGLFEAFAGGLRQLGLAIGRWGSLLGGRLFARGPTWLSGAADSAAWCCPGLDPQRIVRGALFIVAGVFLLLRPAMTLATLAVEGERP
jgi:hypothetical protein